MDLSDARQRISNLVTNGEGTCHNRESWELYRECWSLIQEELNYAVDKRRLDYLEKERKAVRAWMRPD